MTSVFIVWLVGAITGILGVYMTLRSPDTDKAKRGYKIAFIALSLFGLEIAIYQYIDQDSKDFEQSINQQSVIDSGRFTKEAIQKLDAVVPRELTTGEKLIKWANNVDVEYARKIGFEHYLNDRLASGINDFQLKLTPEQFNDLRDIANNDKDGRVQCEDLMPTGIISASAGNGFGGVMKQVHLAFNASVLSEIKMAKQ